MASGLAFDKFELSLTRAFHAVIIERSVSRAALRLVSSQPAMVARSSLVPTAGRKFCARHIGSLPVRWLREQVRDVAQGLLAVKR